MDRPSALMRTQSLMSIARALCVLSGVIVLGASGCGDRPRPEAARPALGDDGGLATDDGGAATGPGDPGAGPPATATDVRVAPHAAPIVAAALDRSGAVAVTLDTLGDVRLWRSLDGKQPPVAMPFHGARALEVAVDAAGLVVGRVDPSGAAHFYRFDRTGHLTATGSAAAVPQAIGLVAMTADTWLLVRADHSLALVDDRGAALDEAARAGVRLEALRPIGLAGALAIISRTRDGVSRFAAIRLDVAAGKLVWGAETALAIDPTQPVELAIGPDGRHLAYFAGPAAVAAAAAAPAADPVAARRPAGPRGEARAPRRIRPADPVLVAVVVALPGGATVTPKDLIDTTVVGPQRLGFSDASTLHVYGSSGGDLTVTLDGDGAVVAGNLGRNSPPAIGPGVIVAGIDRNLVVQRVGGDTRYLGYQLGAPMSAAVAPDGARVAWATADGQIVIETVDGSAADVRVGEVGLAAAALEFLDAGHLLVVSQRGDLTLYDPATGATRAKTAAPGASYLIQIHRRTGWIAGARDGGGVWVVRAVPGAANPWTPAKVIPDGSGTFWLVDAGADADLITVDNKLVARRYTGAQLATGIAIGKLDQATATKLTRLPNYIDLAGRPYTFTADGIRVADQLGGPDRALHTLTAPRDLQRSPDGQAILGFDGERTAYAFRPDGNLRWTLDVGTAGWRPAFSLDGRRVALISGSGGQIVDVATGAVIAARCGWAFGAYPTAPAGFSSQLHSICE